MAEMHHEHAPGFRDEPTNPKKSKDALVADEVRITAILATIEDVVWSISARSYETLYLNPAAEKVYGRSAGAFYQDPELFMNIVHTEDREQVAKMLPMLIEKGSLTIQYRIVRPDGEVRWLDDRVSVARSSEGRPDRIDGVASDITERKRAEAEQERTERRVQELQSELLHVSRLSTMGEMASALAHELNQPLSAITNYLHGSRRLLENSTHAGAGLIIDALDKAAEQALRASQVIQHLREFVTRGVTERRVESIKRLVEEASAFALLAPNAHSVQMSLKCDPAIDLVLVDKVQIQQVLLNLLRNAIEAMQTSPRRVLVVSTELAPEDMVAVNVADSGSGIAPDIASRLFQPFVTTKRTGMGIGLSLSRTIIESHGGQITVGPNSDGGTIFRFTLCGVSPEGLIGSK
jgi:two-component system sensor kinase FixL